jgi:hypothetical protein
MRRRWPSNREAPDRTAAPTLGIVNHAFSLTQARYAVGMRTAVSIFLTLLPLVLPGLATPVLENARAMR